MAHANKGMGFLESSATHSADALKKMKQAENKGVSKKKRPKKLSGSVPYLCPGGDIRK